MNSKQQRLGYWVGWYEMLLLSHQVIQFKAWCYNATGDGGAVRKFCSFKKTGNIFIHCYLLIFTSALVWSGDSWQGSSCWSNCLLPAVWVLHPRKAISQGMENRWESRTYFPTLAAPAAEHNPNLLAAPFLGTS